MWKIHSSALESFEPCGVELWDVFTMDWQSDCFLDKLFSWLNLIECSTRTNCYFRELSILDRINTLQEQIVFIGNYLHVFWTVLKLWLMITKPDLHHSFSIYNLLLQDFEHHCNRCIHQQDCSITFRKPATTCTSALSLRSPSPLIVSKRSSSQIYGYV